MTFKPNALQKGVLPSCWRKVNVGWIYIDARQYDNAIAQFQGILEIYTGSLNCEDLNAGRVVVDVIAAEQLRKTFLQFRS